jgi:CRISPR-associated endonuclease/helicase Cas3
MYDRVKTFVSDQAGLAHGTAGLVVGETEGYTSQAFQSRLYFSTFMQPATVATVDQLILSKFNWRHWELMETNITQSAVVFDEIHAYDLFTLGLTLNAAQELAERGARLCFMSATMPRFLQDAICKLLGEYGGYDVVECPEADAEIRHTLSVRDSFLEDAIDEIVSLFNGGKKILVVANSVDTACGLYEQLEASIGAENTMLFHSRYIEMERRAKEQSIAEENKRTTGFVAVVTQIVEVSLDIDYDVLYTQVAPVDALVQRFGRVNRKGKKDPVPVCIFHPDERSWKVYEEDVLNNALNLLQKLPPNKPVNQADIFNWVEKQYPHEHWLDKVEKARKDAKQKVRSLRKALWYVQTLRFMDENKALMQLAKTREEKFFTVEAVPVCFRAKVEACKYAAERQNYVVRVPAYLAGGKPHYCEDLGISFAAIDYDPVFGAVNR